MKPKAANIIARHPDGRFMLQFRDGNPTSFPLTWCFFGGGLEEGESELDTAVRELSEEVGITAHGEDFKFVGHYDGVKHYVSLFLYTQPLDWGMFRLQEGAATGFFTVAEMKRLNNMTPDNRAMLDLYPEIFTA